MRKKTMLQRFTEKYVVDEATGCWNWTSKVDKKGYGVFSINSRHRFATHASLLIAGNPVPKGLFALHRCDRPGCVNPDHLFIGTHADNMRDMVAKRRARGPVIRGELNGQSKLTPATVNEIRRLRAEGVSLKNLAKIFGVSATTTRRITIRETWCHL